MELIRYIHLNPLRAGLVNDLKELDKYPWTGHSAILGHRKNLLDINITKKKVLSSDRWMPVSQFRPGIEKATNNPLDPVNPACPVALVDGTGVKNKPLAEKTIEDVLLHFGETLKIARRRYRQFVKNGIDQGKRSELQSGGLIRSTGGDKAGLLGRKKEEREKGDERILGSGGFVSRIIEEYEKRYEKKSLNRIALKSLIQEAAQNMGISPAALISKSRDRRVSSARSVIAYLAVKEAGYTQTEISNHLNISQIGVRSCILRGEKMLNKCEKIWKKVT